jgi:CheY-like chemotaxis protein
MKILIVEDDQDKKNDIVGFLNTLKIDFDITTKESSNSGLQQVIFHPGYELVILDMSMCVYDISDSDPSGGGHESFAGKDFLEQMYLRGVMIPVVVVTQFGSFGKGINKVSLPLLDQELHDLYPGFYLGSIYYNSAIEDWKVELKKIIRTGKNCE